MKTRLLLGFGALLACVMLPWIARLPKGWDWVAQYIPDQARLSWIGTCTGFKRLLVY